MQVEIVIRFCLFRILAIIILRPYILKLENVVYDEKYNTQLAI